MKVHMSLSVKVIILVALPLVLQWGFLAWLLTLQAESERSLERSVHAKTVANAIDHLRVDMLTYGLNLAGGELGHGTIDEVKVRQELQSLQSDYNVLRDLTLDDDPAVHKTFVDSEKEVLECFGQLIEIKKSAQRLPVDDGSRRALWQQVTPRMYHALKNDFHGVGEEQADLARRTPAIQAEYRKKQLLIVVALALVTLALAIGSALYLTRGFTLRLAKVSDNAYRLASDRPLNQALGGSDEIAQLDQTFHIMAESLREAEAVKQDVVLMVTHDLRTPLATLQNILKFLRSGNFGKLDAKGSEYILVANRNVERMSNLVNDLLDVEKIQSGLMTLDKQAFELADCFTAARELAGAFAEEQGVKIEVKDTDLMVSADQDRVTRVVANLIANAVKFSPPDGTVTVAANRDGAWIYTEVTDQGPGIPPDQIEHIFERFRQVDSGATKGKGGSGLGLTICQAIVELHGGKIWAENLPRSGSRFIFSLKAV